MKNILLSKNLMNKLCNYICIKTQTNNNRGSCNTMNNSLLNSVREKEKKNR